jgi:peptide/nickel transport system permease protein
VILGIITGLIAGYWGGIIDSIIMRLWDCILAFPTILLGIGVAAFLGPGAMNAGIAVAIRNMPIFSRIIRSSVLSEREKEYVIAEKALGSSDVRIVFQGILPNCLSPILVQIAAEMAFAVLLEAGLSFLGLGAQHPTPSWGSMLQSSRAYLGTAPWYGIFPGVALASMILGLNFFSDALRDALDPRLTREMRK